MTIRSDFRCHGVYGCENIPCQLSLCAKHVNDTHSRLKTFYRPADMRKGVCCRVLSVPIAQNINILTLGNPDGVGVFFPKGLLGTITKPTGYNASDPADQDFPTSASTDASIFDTQASFTFSQIDSHAVECALHMRQGCQGRRHMRLMSAMAISPVISEGIDSICGSSAPDGLPFRQAVDQRLSVLLLGKQ